MAGPTNRTRIDDALQQIAAALDPYISRVVAKHIPAEQGDDWTVLLRVKDEENGHGGRTYARTDPQAQLRMINERFGALGFLFNRELSRAESGFANELATVRNNWAHGDAFSADDTMRALDTAERFLKAIGAPEDAAALRKSRLDVQRSTYAAEVRRDTRERSDMPALSSAQLAPWRTVLTPHADIAADDFSRAEFAADLFQVANGTEESSDYNDPVEFFERTYLTDGLKTLLGLAVRRVAGDLNAAPVVNLQTTFGGGKTHSMLAIWHLFSGRKLDDYPQGLQDLVAELNVPRNTVEQPLERVAIVGTSISPGQSWLKPDGTQINTIWGELAWQLGGAEGYAMIADSDASGTNPGAALRDLIKRYSPCIILIDEWVAYARGLYGKEGLPGGDFGDQFTFAQELTAAVTAVPGAMLLVSIPASDVRRDDEAAVASDLEIGGEHGRAALENLQHVVSRQAHNWTPASSTESFEIVRWRLFRAPDADAQRKIAATARTFSAFYRKSSGELPVYVHDPAYEDRIRNAYPIHPELFDRLYNDWSTLEKFQRTRGVLRLMSAVVHALEVAGDDAPLIMPGSIPINAAAVRDELTGYLDDGDRWKGITDTDIDGHDSVAVRIDQEKTLFRERALTRRIARSIFLGSAPTLGTSHKGIDRKSVFLGVAMPGDTIGNFGSALQLLTERASYLYDEANRYWFDLQVSLNRTVSERASGIGSADIAAEVVARLRRQTGDPAVFADIVYAPDDTADVPESESVRLVIAGPDHVHDGKSTDSKAHLFAHQVATTRGRAARVNANTVVVLAPDQSRGEELADTVRTYLAWRGIERDKDVLDLTQGQLANARRSIERLNATVDQRIRGTWIWLLHPQQSGGEPITTGQVKADGATQSVISTAAAKAHKNDIVNPVYSMQSIAVELQNHLRAKWNDGRITVGELWSYHVRYPYLARLRDKRVFLDAIAGAMTDPAWEQTGFALADDYDAATGDFTGLRLPIEDTAPAITDTTLLVSPGLARAQRDREDERAREESRERDEANREKGWDGPGSIGGATAPPVTGSQRPAPTAIPDARYSGSVGLRPDQDLGEQLHQLVDELLVHLQKAAPDTFEVHVSIDAGKREGFDPSTVRTVRENGKQLGLYPNKFEEG